MRIERLRKRNGNRGTGKGRPGPVFICSVAVPITATGAKAEEALVKAKNVGQGSRQNGLVTLGEELALWDEHRKHQCAPGSRGPSGLIHVTRATESVDWLGWVLELW